MHNKSQGYPILKSWVKNIHAIGSTSHFFLEYYFRNDYGKALKTIKANVFVNNTDFTFSAEDPTAQIIVYRDNLHVITKSFSYLKN